MLKRHLLKSLLGVASVVIMTTVSFAADPLKIVYIGKNTGNPYFDSITGGFTDACKSLGCEFEFVAPATAEATSQIPFIEAQIQRGVNVIGIAPNSPDALNQPRELLERRSPGQHAAAVPLTVHHRDESPRARHGPPPGYAVVTPPR